MGIPNVLISGSGIAGPAAASWLAAAGWDVTVVERFDHVRDEGQNVDVRGVGREVIRRMGLEDAVRAEHTSETGMTFIGPGGRPVASFPVGAEDSAPTAELEILRGRLARLLHDHSAASAEYVFGDRITALHEDGRGVHVDFAHGPDRRFDAVVIAEGARSRTRGLVLPEARVHELGLLWAYFTIPRTADDDRQWRMHLGGRGRIVHLRPDNLGSTRAMLSLRSDVLGFDRLDREGIVEVLRATFGDLGWETPRILDALENNSPGDTALHVDQIAQIRLPVWHRGRVAVLGDAAWCAGPFGTGTTSALAGAYVLAGELGATPDEVPAAFARYERLLRPMTGAAQKSVPAHPRSAWQRALLHTGFRALAHPVGRTLARVTGLGPSLPVQDLVLPDYRFRLPARS
ncbi:FAD-dependent monooxygenase [Amycolatopsis sp. PS_44_ISF1]|uniref:FAD-dependent monooxygenase n=1 Tax=Amycolatopsis sp. PS_44_ISF1 TaxID=2974917 RepID=UPI0028DE1E38|nr:FAD-dependent monooxygenase [Amycolatopsis sp. PS_44_ISF1]MDT8915145.1 FAD-dependent monooxygenase [Amycolatopsis sp. PS_44_ISF1]